MGEFRRKEPGDRVTSKDLRRAHIVRVNDGGFIGALCREISLYDSPMLVIADEKVPTCATCAKRAEAAARKAGGSNA